MFSLDSFARFTFYVYARRSPPLPAAPRAPAPPAAAGRLQFFASAPEKNRPARVFDKTSAYLCGSHDPRGGRPPPR